MTSERGRGAGRRSARCGGLLRIEEAGLPALFGAVRPDLGEKRGHLRSGDRLAEQPALNLVAPFIAQPFELLFGFDALRRRAHAEAHAEAGYRADDRAAPVVVRQIADEGAI